MLESFTCRACGETFLADVSQAETRDCCGQPFCRAKAGWTQDQWDLRARFSDQRIADSLELDEWDREALKRRKAVLD